MLIVEKVAEHFVSYDDKHANDSEHVACNLPSYVQRHNLNSVNLAGKSVSIISEKISGEVQNAVSCSQRYCAIDAKMGEDCSVIRGVMVHVNDPTTT